MKTKLMVLLFVPLLLSSARPLRAASIAVRLGQWTPQGESRLWRENVETFTIETQDFESLIGGVEVAIELNEFVDVAFGIEGYSRRVSSSYREFVRDDGTEIVQDLRLSVAPITAGARFLPFGKFRTLIPYVTGGLGLYPYEYMEEGEFIDFATFDIFVDAFQDTGVGTGGYAGAGLEWAVSRSVLLFGEYRRHWVNAEHSDDFRGFGDFDLDADQLSAGLAIRF